MIDTPWHQLSKEASFLQSLLMLENCFQPYSAFSPWVSQRLCENRFEVEQISLSQLGEWDFVENPHRLVHCSGKFFAIEGIRIQTNYGPLAEWDQPIINQPEIGILGILTRTFSGTRYFLMQLKMEPGNVNLLQLSPTVQATRSNYTQVHKGRLPHYLEYFIEPGRARVLVDQLQSEQGSRFLYKQNRNMVIEVDEDVPLYDDFCWLTLGEIKRLLTVDNLVNMDSRTVLSCIPLAHPDWGFYQAAHSARTFAPLRVFGYELSGFAQDLFLSAVTVRSSHSVDDIVSWFTNLKTRYALSVKRIPLREVRNWVQTEDVIYHETGQYFSVIGVTVQANNREVVSWRQPLLKHTGYGIVGFITQRLDGVLHFLVRASVEPGNRDLLELGPTVACSEPERRSQDATPPAFLALFMNPSPDQVRYNTIQSEEGGRFYHFQNRYMILQLPDDTHLEVPDNFIWMSLRQITDFTRHSYFNIEARNLLSCLSLLTET